MSPSNETLRLLLFYQSQSNAENMVSLLRNSGHSTRAHLVTSLEDFKTQLQSSSWDLLIGEIEAHEIHYSDLQTVIRRLNKDLPIILINQDVDLLQMEDALKHGVATVVPREETNLLVLAIQREIGHLTTRRELRSTQVRLREAEKRSQTMLESSREGVAYISDGMHIHANSTYLKMFGYDSVDELLGMPILDMIDPEAQGDFKKFLKTYMANNEKSADLNTISQIENGKLSPVQMSFSPATFQDEACTQVIVHSTAEEGSTDARLKQMNNLDVMTGLFNKPYFMASLENAADSAVLANAQGAIVYINIDGFGHIKRSVGISSADKVLVELANLLKNHLDGNPTLARIGEDIFTAILMGMTADQALEQAELIRAIIEERLIDIGNSTITVTASIGVALINDNSSKPEDILQQAHYAADSVKEQEEGENGNGVKLYERPVDTQPASLADLDIQQLIMNALKNGTFILLYQPMISLKGDEGEHYETLLRLPDGRGNLISAGDFLNDPQINEVLRRKVDRWVILNAIKRLNEHFRAGHKTRLFINLSAPSLLDESLPGWISVAVRAARLPRGALIIQFNEDDTAKMLKQVQSFSQSLKEKGIDTSISRFGCSVNPLRNLQYVAADYVKIDGSFTQELASNEETMKQLSALLTSLHDKQKKTVLPLVENASSLANLWQMGVHYIQGYYVQEPQEKMAYNFEEESSF